MKYKVITTNQFRTRLWMEGDIVELDPALNPPKHFQPLDEVVEQPKPKPHRTEAQEVAPGKVIEPKGGMAANLGKNEIPRVLTIDKVPIINPTIEPEKKKHGRKAKAKS